MNLMPLRCCYMWSFISNKHKIAYSTKAVKYVLDVANKHYFDCKITIKV